MVWWVACIGDSFGVSRLLVYRSRDPEVGPRLYAATMVEEIERWSPFKSWLYSVFSRNPRSNRAVIAMLDLGHDDRLLDIGCGPGAALDLASASGARVCGVDPSPSMVSRAASRVPAADVREGSAESIPFPDSIFTVAINIASFHHWADRDAGLREVLRVLTPGGRLHIVEAALRSGKDGHGLNDSDIASLKARLDELGYEDVSTEEMKAGWHDFHVISGSAPAFDKDRGVQREAP